MNELRIAVIFILCLLLLQVKALYCQTNYTFEKTVPEGQIIHPQTQIFERFFSNSSGEFNWTEITTISRQIVIIEIADGRKQNYTKMLVLVFKQSIFNIISGYYNVPDQELIQIPLQALFLFEIDPQTKENSTSKTIQKNRYNLTFVNKQTLSLQSNEFQLNLLFTCDNNNKQQQFYFDWKFLVCVILSVSFLCINFQNEECNKITIAKNYEYALLYTIRVVFNYSMKLIMRINSLTSTGPFTDGIYVFLLPVVAATVPMIGFVGIKGSCLKPLKIFATLLLCFSNQYYSLAIFSAINIYQLSKRNEEEPIDEKVITKTRRTAFLSAIGICWFVFGVGDEIIESVALLNQKAPEKHNYYLFKITYIQLTIILLNILISVPGISELVSKWFLRCVRFIRQRAGKKQKNETSEQELQEEE